MKDGGDEEERKERNETVVPQKGEGDSSKGDSHAVCEQPRDRCLRPPCLTLTPVG